MYRTNWLMRIEYKEYGFFTYAYVWELWFPQGNDAPKSRHEIGNYRDIAIKKHRNVKSTIVFHYWYYYLSWHSWYIIINKLEMKKVLKLIKMLSYN